MFYKNKTKAYLMLKLMCFTKTKQNKTKQNKTKGVQAKVIFVILLYGCYVLDGCFVM